MVGLGPRDMPASAPIKFVGAGTAACIADLMTFPLDTAKVRLQVDRNTSATNCDRMYRFIYWSGGERNKRTLIIIGPTNNYFMFQWADSGGGQSILNEVSRGVWHHLNHCTHRGPKESVQWPGGRTPEADELCLCSHWPV